MHASAPLWTCYIWPATVGPWGKRMRRREIIAPISSAAAALPLAAALTSKRSLMFEERKAMPRIVHIAIKVDDLEKATKFYEEVFGFRQTSTGYARGH